jgi:hypothetical protein
VTLIARGGGQGADKFALKLPITARLVTVPKRMECGWSFSETWKVFEIEFISKNLEGFSFFHDWISFFFGEK